MNQYLLIIFAISVTLGPLILINVFINYYERKVKHGNKTQNKVKKVD